MGQSVTKASKRQILLCFSGIRKRAAKKRTTTSRLSALIDVHDWSVIETRQRQATRPKDSSFFPEKNGAYMYTCTSIYIYLYVHTCIYPDKALYNHSGEQFIQRSYQANSKYMYTSILLYVSSAHQPKYRPQPNTPLVLRVVHVHLPLVFCIWTHASAATYIILLCCHCEGPDSCYDSLDV